MTAPIDPGNTEALAKIAYDQLWHFHNERFEERGDKDQEKYRKVADAVARSVCPPDCVVVRRDDLETALYGSQYWGEELRQDGEQEALDRLRALIGDGHA